MKLNRIALFSTAIALMILTVPFAFGCEPTGWVTGGGQCITPLSGTIPSASFGFNAMWSKDGTPKGEINYVDLITGQHVHVHELTYLHVWGTMEGNKPSELKYAEFKGYDVYSGLLVEVHVEDHGEPGTNDIFHIDLGGVHLGGSNSVPILAGNIQTHKLTGGPT